jgi:hypothetical protein
MRSPDPSGLDRRATGRTWIRSTSARRDAQQRRARRGQRRQVLLQRRPHGTPLGARRPRLARRRGPGRRRQRAAGPLVALPAAARGRHLHQRGGLRRVPAPRRRRTVADEGTARHAGVLHPPRHLRHRRVLPFAVADVHCPIGHRVEDEPGSGDGACSSAGAFGFHPWISPHQSTWGVLALLVLARWRESGRGSADVRAPDRAAWFSGKARRAGARHCGAGVAPAGGAGRGRGFRAPSSSPRTAGSSRRSPTG